MKNIVLAILLLFVNLCYSQITITTEKGKDIEITSMETLPSDDVAWQKAMQIVLPDDYEMYCSYYLSVCPISRESFLDYKQQVSQVQVEPIYKSSLKIEGVDYLFFAMEYVFTNGFKQLVPLLVLENDGNYRLMMQEQEQQLYGTKMLFTYLNPETFLLYAPEEFEKSQKIKEITIYNRFLDEASKKDTNPQSLFRLPQISENKSLPVKYQGMVKNTYTSEEYQRALLLHQRGLESEAMALLSSRISIEELEKIIKDEVRN